MTAPSPTDPGLARVCAAFARARAEALAAVLSSGGPLDAAGRAWAADAADGMLRISVHALNGRLPAGAPGHVDAEALEDPSARAALARGAEALAAALPPPAGRPDVPLSAVAEAAGRDAAAAGVAAGIDAALDWSYQDGATVPGTVAGALLDALGRVLRDTVRYSTGAETAVRVVGHTERETLVLVVGDRGRTGGGAAPEESLLDPRREAGLHAAAGCLSAVGGDVSAGVGPWGGVSITLRVPLG